MKRKRSKYAVVAFFLALAGVIVSQLAPVSIIVAFFSLWHIRRSRGLLRGRILAIAAILFGIFSIVAWIGKCAFEMDRQSYARISRSGTKHSRILTHSDLTNGIAKTASAETSKRAVVQGAAASVSTKAETFDFDRQTSALIRRHLTGWSNAMAKCMALLAIQRSAISSNQATQSIKDLFGVVYKCVGSNDAGLIVKEGEKIRTLSWTLLSDQTLSRLRPDVFSSRITQYSNTLNKTKAEYSILRDRVASGMVLYEGTWTNRDCAVVLYRKRQHRIQLQEREIWQEAFWNYERGNSQALIEYPASDDDSKERIRLRDAYAQRVENRLNHELCKKYEIDLRTLNDINKKGMSKYWPGDMRPELKEKVNSDAGPKPVNDQWDAEVPEVVEYVHSQFNDPKVEYVQWWKPMLENEHGTYYWRVRVKLRARNQFGAYRLVLCDFYIQHNRVVKYREH
jgi:hypothetical protein